MYKALPAACPVLEMQDRRRQFVEHVNAMRSQKAVIDCRCPVAPGRIAFRRRQHERIQHEMMKVGEDNLRVIADQKEKAHLAKTRKSATHLSKNVLIPIVKSNKVDWISIVTAQASRNVSADGQSGTKRRRKLGHLSDSSEVEKKPEGDALPESKTEEDSAAE
jgi:hypothetical protein